MRRCAELLENAASSYVALFRPESPGPVIISQALVFPESDAPSGYIDGAKQDEANGFQLQLGNFIASLSGDSTPTNNADQAVALMKMIDAIYASSELGREVPIT